MTVQIPIVDKGAALARIGDDLELYSEICEIYIDDAPRLLSALFAGIDGPDRNIVERNAHSLKSASANVGAERARAAAWSLEQKAQTAAPGELQALADDLKEEIETALPELKTSIIGG